MLAHILVLNVNVINDVENMLENVFEYLSFVVRHGI